MSNPTDMARNYLYKQHDVEADLTNGLADCIREQCPKIDRQENLSVEEFQKEYVQPSKPVILSGLIKDWLDGDRYTIEDFAKACGESEVLINLYDTKATESGTIKSLVDKIKANDREEPVYLQEWWFQTSNPDLLSGTKPIEHFADDWVERILGFRNHTLWIGSQGAQTPIHEDTPYFNLSSVQLCGKKEWFLFSKEACLHTDESGKPDYDRFLNDPTTQAQSGILERGDILFMPYKWWHRTETLEDAASLNTAYVTEDIIQEHMKSLFTIPLLVALRSDELKALNPMRYNVTMERIQNFAHLLGFDPDYVISAIKNAHAPANDENKQKAA